MAFTVVFLESKIGLMTTRQCVIIPGFCSETLGPARPIYQRKGQNERELLSLSRNEAMKPIHHIGPLRVGEGLILRQRYLPILSDEGHVAGSWQAICPEEVH